MCMWLTSSSSNFLSFPGQADTWTPNPTPRLSSLAYFFVFWCLGPFGWALLTSHFSSHHGPSPLFLSVSQSVCPFRPLLPLSHLSSSLWPAGAPWPNPVTSPSSCVLRADGPLFSWGVGAALVYTGKATALPPPPCAAPQALGVGLHCSCHWSSRLAHGSLGGYQMCISFSWPPCPSWCSQSTGHHLLPFLIVWNPLDLWACFCSPEIQIEAASLSPFEESPHFTPSCCSFDLLTEFQNLLLIT